MSYGDLVQRNAGYVPIDVQRRIRETRLLVAGCGVGSTIAEAAVRLGFEHVVLVDGDTVESHNLNRQAFVAADVGRPKVEALARRLRAIHPGAEVEEIGQYVTPDTARRIVARADLVIDTIDFLDLAAITAVHDEARRQNKVVLSAMTAGWGAAALYFPPDGCTFRELVGLPPSGPVGNESYVKRYAAIVARLVGALDPAISRVVGRSLETMEDGRPCPVPQVSAGAAAVAGLVVTIARRVLGGEPVTPAPKLLLFGYPGICAGEGVDLTASAPPTSERSTAGAPI